MMNKQPKETKCKCGHEKEVHHKSRFNGYTYCIDCPCESFFRRDRPTSWDKWSRLGMGIFAIIVSAGFVALIGLAFFTLPQEALDMPLEFNMTVNDEIIELFVDTIYGLSVLIFISSFAIGGWLASYGISEIMDYKHMKDKRTFD